MSIVHNILSVGLLIVGVSSVSDFEVVLFPPVNSNSKSEVSLSFSAFGRNVDLLLVKNENLFAPDFQVWVHNEGNVLQKTLRLSKPERCLYLHSDSIGSAAINLCELGVVQGFVFLENVTLEITPLSSTDFEIFGFHRIGTRSGTAFGEPHIVKRTSGSRSPSTLLRTIVPYDLSQLKDRRKIKKGAKKKLTIELAVFFDEAGYHLFYPFLDRSNEKVRDMLLAYVNGIQAIYHHPSLGEKIDIALVRLEIMLKQPSDLPHFSGERSSLLNSFCRYSKKHNPSDDKDPRHWDIGLYVSGLDFYANENGKKNGVTMGLAAVGGICLEDYSCVIAELGATNHFGKPYPSAGFTSVYIAAHEIGHNLGMHHDSTGNICPRDGFIMSPSRGTEQGETMWSECSRKVALSLVKTKSCLLDSPKSNNKELDHARFFNTPGKEWDAKKQCEILLRDRDAYVVTLKNACQALQCKSPHRDRHYYAGPALDGTMCDSEKECRGGECVSVMPTITKNSTVIWNSGWNQWIEEPCTSGCIEKSTGAFIRHRTCTKSENDCDGLPYEVHLCKDVKLCKKTRTPILEYTAAKCALFSEFITNLDGSAGGLQAPHETRRPWVACAIFCWQKNTSSFYSPRKELNDVGIDAYFPDGTWCHSREGEHYFCRQHHCLPESFDYSIKNESYINGISKMEVLYSNKVNSDKINFLKTYLSLGINKLSNELNYNLMFDSFEDESIDKDYIEISDPTITSQNTP